MIIEVFIEQGNPQDSKLIKDGVTHDLTLSTQELTNLILSVAELQAFDNTNCGWVIPNAEAASFYFKNESIDSNITCTDKGGIIDPGSPGYTNLNDLVTSILNRI